MDIKRTIYGHRNTSLPLVTFFAWEAIHSLPHARLNIKLLHTILIWEPGIAAGRILAVGLLMQTTFTISPIKHYTSEMAASVALGILRLKSTSIRLQEQVRTVF